MRNTQQIRNRNSTDNNSEECNNEDPAMKRQNTTTEITEL